MDGARKHRVAVETFRLVRFSGVNVGFAGVTNRVDQECGSDFFQQADQRVTIGVVVLRPRNTAMRNRLRFELLSEFISNVSGMSE